MANSLTTNPWVVDTPAATILFKTNIHVIQFEYAGYAAQGNQCIVNDRNGKAVWLATGEADLSPVRSGNVGWIEGMAVPTLDGGGILRIFFK